MLIYYSKPWSDSSNASPLSSLVRNEPLSHPTSCSFWIAACVVNQKALGLYLQKGWSRAIEPVPSVSFSAYLFAISYRSEKGKIFQDFDNGAFTIGTDLGRIMWGFGRLNRLTMWFLEGSSDILGRYRSHYTFSMS